MSNPIQLPRFQFSLRWLLIAVTVVAVLLGISVYLGSVVAQLLWVAIGLVLPVPFVIVAIFGRGPSQAFAIGALLPWLMLVLGRIPGSWTGSLFLLVLCVISGVVAAATRIWLDHQAGR